MAIKEELNLAYTLRVIALIGLNALVCTMVALCFGLLMTPSKQVESVSSLSQDLQRIVNQLPENKESVLKTLAERSWSKPSDEAVRLYILGQVAQRAEEFTKAEKFYAQIDLMSIPSLADRIMFHRGEIAAQAGDESKAQQFWQRLLIVHPQSISSSSARYEMARSMLRQGKKDRAKLILSEIQSLHPTSQQAIGALYYQGQLTQSQAERYELWCKYLKLSPDGRFAREIADAIVAQGMLDSIGRNNVAAAYLATGDPEMSLKLLEGATLDLSNWMIKVKALNSLNRKVEAIDLLEVGLRDFKGDITTYGQALNLYITLAEKSRCVNFLRNLAIAPKSPTLPAVLRKLAALSGNKGRLPYLKRLLTEYPNNPHAASASAVLFWDSYSAGDLNTAEKLANEHLLRYAKDDSTAMVQFWLGKLAESRGATAMAKDLYSNTLHAFPHSYYGFRASGRMKAIAGGEDPGWRTPATMLNLDRPGLAEASKVKLPVNSIAALHPTVQTLLIINMWQEALSLISPGELEGLPALKAWVEYVIDESPIQAIRTAELALKPAQASMQTHQELWKLAYPLIYLDELVFSCNRNNLNPALLLGLVRQESRFMPKIVSRSGAVGLGQFLPSTARGVAAQLGLPSPTHELLVTPSYNLALGARYLSDLIQQFGGRAELAVASYNAGPGAVSRWQRELATADPDRFIEDIPYQETREYVKNVFTNFWIYSLLMQDLKSNSAGGE